VLIALDQRGEYVKRHDLVQLLLCPDTDRQTTDTFDRLLFLVH